MTPSIELTIAIPTFNGNKTLPYAIESVLNQNIKLIDRNSIEIIVIDNCSTDATTETCKRYEDKHGDLIRVYRNNSNIGYDRNIDLIFTKSKGNFVKILCDDDELLSGALIKLLDATRVFPNASVFVSNFQVFDSEMSKLIHEMEIGDGINQIYKTPEDFLNNAKGRYGQTSSLMFKRKNWLEHPSEPGVGSLHMHAFKVFQLTNLLPGVVMPEPLVRCRTGSPNFHTTTISQVTAPLAGLKMIESFNNLHPRPIYQQLILDQKRYIASIIKNLKQLPNISQELEAELKNYAEMVYTPPP